MTIEERLAALGLTAEALKQHVGPRWTIEEVVTLIVAARAGVSADVAGKRIGRSRSTALGKARRINATIPCVFNSTGGGSGANATQAQRRSRAKVKPAMFSTAPPRPQRAPIEHADEGAPAAPLANYDPAHFEVRDELVIPEKEKKSVVTLTDNCCRWPIGDPKRPGFHFCGKSKVPGRRPYCEFHERKALQPSQPRRFADDRGRVASRALIDA